METGLKPVIVQETAEKQESEGRSPPVDASAVPTELRALQEVADNPEVCNVEVAPVTLEPDEAEIRKTSAVNVPADVRVTEEELEEMDATGVEPADIVLDKSLTTYAVDRMDRNAGNLKRPFSRPNIL